MDFIMPFFFVLLSIVIVVIPVIHISFSLAVLADAKRLRQQMIPTFFVGGGIWALATLVGGVFAAGVYWVIHHSTLRR